MALVRGQPNRARQNYHDNNTNKNNAVRDLSTAPAWIGSPDLSGVDLLRTQTFAVDKKEGPPRKRHWHEDWRELVIGASPYSRHVAPVPERRVVTVQEVVARKMAKFRAKLGITAAELAPASVALESSEGLSEGDEDVHTDGDGVGDEAGVRVRVRPSTTGRRRCKAPVDIGFWKKETEEMMTLLGTTAESAHGYPMTELKRAMSSSPSSSRPLRGQNGPPDKPAERASTAGNPTIGGEGGYALPEYRHGAPWPRPRPTAAVAERARRRRRAREERGASTPADAHAELEEKVAACLFGVLPEEYCRDAPPQTAKEEGGGVSGGGLPLATGKAAKASIRTRPSAPISNISSAGGGGTEHLASDQTPRQGRSQPAPKRQRGTAAAGEGSGPKASGEDNERSRRRLAAFLSRNEVSRQGGGGADARSLKSSAHEPSSPGGAQRWGNSIEHAFGLGGDESASTAPSQSMAANFIGLLEDSLGHGVWADPVASELARPLDAILAYLPPEGARLYEDSGRRFQPLGHSTSSQLSLPAEVTGGRKIASPPPESVDGNPRESGLTIVAAAAGVAKSATPTPATGRPTALAASSDSNRCPSSSMASASGPGGEFPTKEAFSLTATMEHGAVDEAPRAVWLGRVAAVMEARGDRDEAVRLYGEASAVLTGDVGDREGSNVITGAGSGFHRLSGGIGRGEGGCGMGALGVRSGFVASGGGGGGGGDLFPYSARAHHLASMIARAYRRHFNRRGVAQTLVAASFRGYSARADARRDQKRKSSVADFIKRAWCRYMARRHKAAAKFQALARGAEGRRKYKRLQLTIGCSIVVQSVARRALAVILVRRLRLEQAAAKRLQTVQRGFALRNTRATAISEIHGELWRAARGLNRVARGFLHRRFAGMLAQFAVDNEIDRSQKEAEIVRRAVRLAVARVDMYLTTDAGKADLALEIRRARAAAAQSNTSMRGASPARRKLEAVLDVFNSYDLDGSGTIDDSELAPLLGALGVKMTDAELKVVAASVDADGSGDISFSEFYAWFAGEPCHGTGVDFRGFDEFNEGSQRLNPYPPGGSTPNRTVMDMGLKNAAGLGFAKVHRNVREATGMALKDRGRRGVVRRWVASVAREAQVRFRETRSPPLECCACHQAFALYGDYWKHFGGGSLAGAGLVCPKKAERGRLFADPTVVGEELRLRRAAERQWTRWLDERACLEAAGVKAEAAEEARITAKGSAGPRELASISARLLAVHLSELKSSGPFEGKLSPEKAKAKIARIAFQAFDRDRNGTLHVSDFADLLRNLQELGNSPVVAEGIEAAIDKMDKDHSGQIRLRDFMAWFGVPLPDDRVKPPRSRPVGRVTFIDDTGGDSAIDLRGRQQGGQHENMKQIYVEVRGRGDIYDRLGEEETGEGGNGNGDSSSSACSNSKRSSFLSDKTTAATDDGKGKKGGRWGAKVAAFGSWLGRKEKAKGGVGSSHQTKRKWTTSGLKEKQELQRDGDTDTNIVSQSHTTAGDQKRATKRRRRDDDEPSAKHLLASSAAASRSPTASGNGGSVFSLNVSSRLRGRRPPEDPLKKYGKMLSVVAEQEARTLLLRRARLRVQITELARFRETRPPEHDAWGTPEFLNKHRQSVWDISEEADAAFVETLQRNLREAEDAVRGTTRTSPSPLTRSRDSTASTSTAHTAVAAPGAKTSTPPANTEADLIGTAVRAIGAVEAIGGGVGGGREHHLRDAIGGIVQAPSDEFTLGRDTRRDSGGSRGISGRLMPSRFSFVRSLGRSWRRRRRVETDGVGRATSEQSHAADFSETVKAIESDAALARRRAFHTSTGLAEIARAVRKLKAANLMAVASMKTEGGETEERTRAESNLVGDENLRNKAVTPTKAMAESKAMADKAVQLFDLFDADGSGAIDREELAPLLRQLGISVSAAMETEMLHMLDLDCSGDVQREELVEWLQKEGAAFRRTASSRLLRVGQQLLSRGNSTRRLESQVRASMIARARSTARAEFWALSASSYAFAGLPLLVFPPSSAAAAPVDPLSLDVVGLPTSPSEAMITIDAEEFNEKHEAATGREGGRGGGRGGGGGGGGEGGGGGGGGGGAGGVRLGGASCRVLSASGLTQPRQNKLNERGDTRTLALAKMGGRALASRAAERRRLLEQQEREAEGELFLRRAEDEAERHIKRRWRTRAGAAELQREQDRLRGAGKGLDLKLRAWNTAAGGDGRGRSALSQPALIAKKEDEKLRHLFRLFDTSCDGCIDAEELGRLLSHINIHMSEPELMVLLHDVDKDGSGDVNYAEFSAWWHKERLKRAQSPAAVVGSAVAAVTNALAPLVALRRDAQRALVSRARTEARTEVREALRLEKEATLPASTTASSTIAPKAYVPSALSTAMRRNNRTPEMREGGVESTDVTNNGGSGSGGGDGRGNGLDATRLVNARASKLVRAEAEAYADVEAAIRTPAGKRELARRTRSLRQEWKACVTAATRAARGRSPPRAGAGRVGRADDGAGTPVARELAELVELPFLRFLWRVHGSASATTPIAMEQASGPCGKGVEPSEVKYFSASMRPLLGTRRKTRGREATILCSTLALGRIAGAGQGRGHTPEETGAATGGLSLSGIFDDASGGEVHGVKTLARVGFEDLAVSLGGTPSTAINTGTTSPSVDTAGLRRRRQHQQQNNSEGRAQPKSRRKVLADLAMVARLRLRLFVVPGAFRALAKEAMRAEARAFERHELARSLALEDGEPWRVTEAAAAKREADSAGGVVATDVDRLRATTAGAARLARALAQGEDLAASECRSFLRTSAGRQELAEARVVVRERRRLQEAKMMVGGGGGGGVAAGAREGRLTVGSRALTNLVSTFKNLPRDELQRAFSLCEADGAAGEISGSEAAHVLSYAGIPQTTVATAGLVRVPRPGASPGRLRRQRNRSWGWWPLSLLRSDQRGRTKRSSSSASRLRHPVARFPQTFGGSTGVGRTRASRDIAKVCPTSDGIDSVVAVPTGNDRSGGGGDGDGHGGRGVNGGLSIVNESHHHKERGGGLKSDKEDSDIDDDVDDRSDEQFSVDVDVVDDVTCDEGFELGEMEILLEAAQARQTLLAKAASVLRVLALRALPTTFAETRNARILLMSRARSAGRDKAMLAFENLLTIGKEGTAHATPASYAADNYSIPRGA